MTRQLDGKNVIITGANCGIGYETALELAKRNARVIIACRSKERGKNSLEKLKNESKSDQIELEILDLASLKSIKAFSERILAKLTRIDILINNAGVANVPYSKTEDGFETTFGVNYLGPFYLTNLLLDLIKKSSPSRIINVSSLGHRFGKINWDDLQYEKSYSSLGAYFQSKLANIMFTVELARRLEGTGVTTVSLHPGFVATELSRDHGHQSVLSSIKNAFINLSVKLFATDSRQGAATTIYCATDDSIPQKSGAYFDNCQEVLSSPISRNQSSALKLWEISANLVGLN